MEIEILTTKKKLTKSIIKQFEPAKQYDLDFLISTEKMAYYVRDIGAKYVAQVGIFKSINGWRLFQLYNWKESAAYNTRITAKGIGGCRIRDFESTEERDKFLDTYNKAKNLALKNHLIL